MLTDARIPGPAVAHFLMHCDKLSMPLDARPLACDAPRMMAPAGESTRATNHHYRGFNA